MRNIGNVCAGSVEADALGGNLLKAHGLILSAARSEAELSTSPVAVIDALALVAASPLPFGTIELALGGAESGQPCAFDPLVARRQTPAMRGNSAHTLRRASGDRLRPQPLLPRSGVRSTAWYLGTEEDPPCRVPLPSDQNMRGLARLMIHAKGRYRRSVASR